MRESLSRSSLTPRILTLSPLPKDGKQTVMNTGAERAADAGPEGTGLDQPESWLGPAVEEPAWETISAPALPDPARTPGGIRLLAGLLVLLALAWIGLFGWSLWQSLPALAPAPIAAALATCSAPLILLALLWLWLGRTPRREAERFSRAIEAMR